MKPYEAGKLPVNYKMDKELINLVGDANEKYGQYKSLLETFEFDSKFFLESLLLGESLKTTQIEGTEISQDDLYYLKYKENNDDIQEINNFKEMIKYAEKEIKEHPYINLNLINNMHKILLNSVRGADKNPGQLRITQNWIAPRGIGMDGAVFIPPKPEDVSLLLDNLFEYMNDQFIDPIFINLAISHAQFETIHPYSDGNGRLGRSLIPIQLSILKKEQPILFLSEVIELYKPTYYRTLNESREGNIVGFIKFFLQCVIEQCNSNIYKIRKINEIYKEDWDKLSILKGSTPYRAMPHMIKLIVFTKKELMESLGVHINTVNRLLDKFEELGIVTKKVDKKVIVYQYKRAYDVFISNYR